MLTAVTPQRMGYAAGSQAAPMGDAWVHRGHLGAISWHVLATTAVVQPPVIRCKKAAISRHNDDDDDAGGGTRTPDTRIMIPLL